MQGTLHARRVDRVDGLAELLPHIGGHPEPEFRVKGTGQPALSREIAQAGGELQVGNRVVEEPHEMLLVLDLVGLHRACVGEVLPLVRFFHGGRGVHDDLEVVGLLDQRAGFDFRVEVLRRDGLDHRGAAAQQGQTHDDNEQLDQVFDHTIPSLWMNCFLRFCGDDTELPSRVTQEQVRFRWLTRNCRIASAYELDKPQREKDF